MSDTETLLDTAGAPFGQWRLSEVQLANWGTFDGAIYRVSIARRGHLVTGPSGSGKSSLLDAIAAVLTPDKWLRLNQAAQGPGSRFNQRTLLSYVRGAWSRTVDETEDRVVSAYLRPRATWSGIVLRFDDGAGQTVSLSRLFFLRASATTAADINDLCLLERSAVDLRELESFASSGLETRKAQQAWPDAVVTSNHSHGRFYARMRSLFGITDETALQLLHKTQSAKSLDSLDQLFREYMLERPVTFDLAQTAVDQFGELRDAHDRVVQLRQQRDHLLSLKVFAEKYDAARAVAANARTLIDAVEPYQRRRSLDLAKTELAELNERLVILRIDAETADQAYADADTAWSTANNQALRLGGDQANRLRERIREAQQRAKDTRERWKRFETDLRNAGIPHAPQDADAFAELMRAIEEILADRVTIAGPSHEQLERLSKARSEHEQLEQAVRSLRSTGSTVPHHLLTIRSMLADELAVPLAALPFAAELLEVDPGYAEWTGAIERVLRPLALTLLIRSEHLRDARRWIDARRLPGRLVYEEVTAGTSSPRPARSDNSLVNRVRVNAGPFATWVSSQLSERFDYACVNSPDMLDSHIRAVTINGQVKTSRTRYEKDDRRAINDRAQWVLGNHDAKLEALVEQRGTAENKLAAATEAVDRIMTEQREAQVRQGILETLRGRHWHDLDHMSIATMADALQAQLDSLTREDSDLTAAIKAEHAAREARTQADEDRTTSHVELSRSEEAAEELARVVARLEDDLTSSGLPAQDEIVTKGLDERFRSVRRSVTREAIGEIGQQVTRRLGQELDDALRDERRASEELVALATQFNGNWPAAAASAELTPGVDDRHNYLELFDTIIAHGLPEHEANFLRLLRERSRDMIGELVSDILNAPREIEERVRPVNASLRRSPFDEGRYLNLRVKTRRTETVTRFIGDLRTISEGSWSDDSLESAERRFSILADIMRRLASSEHPDRVWRQQCLDTRQHVTFLAEEVDENNRVEATYDSGAAMSGGQQQKLVIFCLAAALRYQLADADDNYPRYGAIVLDEAFDKADTRYTRMALDIFVEFGFQMVLATPQKLLQTIEPYVGAATSIENPTRRRSEISEVQWDEPQSEAT